MRSSSSSTLRTRVSARLPESWRISSRWRGVSFSWYVSRLVCLLFVLFFMSHPRLVGGDRSRGAPRFELVHPGHQGRCPLASELAALLALARSQLPLVRLSS